jgi:hypothetical protein
MVRAVRERVVVDEAIEVVRQRAGHCGGATRAGAIHEALHPMVGKAMDPFAQCRIGKMERVRAAILSLEIKTYHAWGQAEIRVWIRVQAP